MQNNESAKRVLFADDTEDTRRLVEMALRKAGFVVDLARDGKEALQFYRDAKEARHPYDLLLLDAAMPEIDGYAVADQIRADGDNDVLIAFFTAFDEPMAAVRAAMVNAVAVWNKPKDMSELANLVLRVLE